MDEQQGKVVFEGSGPQSPEEIVRGIFGISLNELIRRIQINENGQYDSLYTADEH